MLFLNHEDGDGEYFILPPDEDRCDVVGSFALDVVVVVDDDTDVRDGDDKDVDKFSSIVIRDMVVVLDLFCVGKIHNTYKKKEHLHRHNTQ